jgi:hypothetical protein
MDLGLFFRVIWRFRILVALGLVIALSLTVLAMARVSFSGGPPRLVYRQHEQWQSYTTLIVSPRGFPWGRSVFSLNYDPSRYASLATIYANLAESDAVKRRMIREDPHATILAKPLLAGSASNAPPLPLFTVAATARSGGTAVTDAEHATSAFLQFLKGQQSDNGIPQKARVNVAVIKHATKPELLKGRSKTTPAAVFLTVMLAFIGLAFMLENLRPRVRVVSEEAEPVLTRHTA